MKKFYLLLMFACVWQFTQAQNYITVDIKLKDSTGSPYAQQASLQFINTDSSNGLSINHYGTYSQRRYPLQSYHYYYFDTIGYSSSYSGGQLSVWVGACNNMKFDTTFSNQDHIDWTITLPCHSPCNATFDTISAQAGDMQFNSSYPNTNYTHYWDFGDSTSSTNANVLHTYGANGSYFVTHIVHNTHTGCYDTAYMYIGISTICDVNADFQTSVLSSQLIRFSPVQSSWHTSLTYFGDGDSAFGQTVDHQYSQAGTYTVTRIVRNPYLSGCLDTVVKQVVVQSGCNAAFTATDFGNGITGFVAGSKMPGLTHFWNFGDGNTAYYLDSINHQYTQNGTYNVQHVVFDSSTNCSDTLTKQVVINNYCGSADFSFTYKSNGNVLFTASDKAGGLAHYWYFGDGNSSILSDSVNHQYIQNGSYDVLHVVVDSVNNCTDSLIRQVVTNNYCGSANFNFTYQNNGMVDFAATDLSAGLIHYWNFGDGNSMSFHDSVSHQYNQNDTFDVLHTVVDTINNCTDSVYRQINITSVCSADFSFTVYNTLAVFNSASYPSTATHFWYYGDGKSGTQASHNYLITGTYYAKLVINNNGCSDSITKAVTVTAACNANFNPVFQSEFNWKFNRADSLNGSPRWYFGDGDSSFSHNPTHTYSSGGVKSVTLDILDSLGGIVCTYSRNITMNICGGQYSSGTVTGTVRFNGQVTNDYDSVRVYLIEHDSNAGTLLALDSVIVYNQDTGSFFFQPCNVTNRILLIKAACLPGSKYYSSTIPTYYDSSLLWSGAKSATTSYNYIYMINGNHTGGPGFIGGYISQGANKSGGALDGIEVLLLTGAGDPVTYTYTSNGGRYEFSNLALGTYRVLVEVLGKYSEEYVITLSQQNQSSDNNDFEVNKKDVSKPNAVIFLNKENMKVYPVPTNGTLTIESSEGLSGMIDYAVYDISGKNVLSGTYAGENGNSILNLDVSELSTGYYTLKLNSAEMMGRINFIKN